jgi:hypothetical protein
MSHKDTKAQRNNFFIKNLCVLVSLWQETRRMKNA